MKNLLFSLFAIGLAGVAAIAATTAMLNTPAPRVSARVENIGPPKQDEKPEGATPAPSIPAPPGGPVPAPNGIPDADKPAPGGADMPAEPPADAPKPAAEPGKEEPEADEDPYEGIAPEELPPDLQYDADASVSFPTNT